MYSATPTCCRRPRHEKSGSRSSQNAAPAGRDSDTDLPRSRARAEPTPRRLAEANCASLPGGIARRASPARPRTSTYARRLVPRRSLRGNVRGLAGSEAEPSERCPARCLAHAVIGRRADSPSAELAGTTRLSSARRRRRATPHFALLERCFAGHNATSANAQSYT